MIYNSQSSSPSIRVIDKDSTLIKDNIYLFDITIWNSGQLPIDGTDIRRAIHINLSHCEKLLDYKIIKEKYPDITKVSITEDNCSNKNGKCINIIWDHLDPSLGFKLQIMYVNKLASNVYLDGMISGINSFNDSSSLKEKNALLYWILYAVMLIIMQIAVWKLMNFASSFTEKHKERFIIRNRDLSWLFRITISLIPLIAFYMLFFYLISSSDIPQL